MSRIIPLLLTLLAAPACATRGQPIRHAEQHLTLDALASDVVTYLGAPETIVHLREHPAACIERWSYAGSVRRERQEVLFVDFDEEGRVCDYAWGETAPASETEATFGGSLAQDRFH